MLLNSGAQKEAAMAQEYPPTLTAWADRWNDVWHSPQAERGPSLTHVQRDHLGNLYPFVAEPLCRLGATAKHRWHGATVQDRSYALFGCLAEALIKSRRPLPVTGDLIPLLMTITYWRSIDRFREERPLDLPIELTDARSSRASQPSPEEMTASSLDDPQLIAAVLAFWADLPWPECRIMQLRHRGLIGLRQLLADEGDDTRFRPFVSVAAHLGGQYKPDTVEKTYKRALKRTQEHLRSLGLLGD